MNNSAYIYLRGYKVELLQNPTNTYSILKVVNETVSKLVIAGRTYEQVCADLTVIMDNETPLPNVKYVIEQD